MSLAPPFKPDSVYPRSYVLTQPFHYGTSYNSSPHLALDMAGYLGQPLYAAESGQVFQASWNGGGWAIGGGWTVIINHVGSGNRISKSSYAHMQRVVVWPGQYVLRGQLIGYTDNTGNSSGSHCHFAYCEIYANPAYYANWMWQNPARYFRAHSFQNGSYGNGDLAWSPHTQCTQIVGVFANGAPRQTNIRSGPYLNSPIVRTVTGRSLMVFLGHVTGSGWNGTRTWNKVFDPVTGRIAYVHRTLTLWVV